MESFSRSRATRCKLHRARHGVVPCVCLVPPKCIRSNAVMLCVCARLAMAQILYSIGVSGGQESMTLALKYFAKAASQSQIIKIKTAQHLDSIRPKL